MLTPQQISAAVDTLHNAEAIAGTGTCIDTDLPRYGPGRRLRRAKGWVDRKLAQGREVIGYKIGLTSRAMQMTMKIDTPDYGVLLTTWYSPTAAR